VPSSPIDVLVRHPEPLTPPNPHTEPSGLPGLAEILDRLPDPRTARGRRYRLGPLLVLCLLAVVSGATSLAAVGRYASGCTPDLLDRIGIPARRRGRLAVSTIGRLLSRLDGDALDQAVYGYLTRLADNPADDTAPRSGARPRLTGIAIDGKTLRGSRTGTGARHLLAATRHDTQTVLAQRQIDTGGNEIGAFTPLLDHLDLAGTVITCDAMHTQHEHARRIVALGGHYIFLLKANQPALQRVLKNLPWRDIPLDDRTAAPDTAAARSAGSRPAWSTPLRRSRTRRRRSRSNAAAPTARPARPPSSRLAPSPA
jgi:hypothetical protein